MSYVGLSWYSQDRCHVFGCRLNMLRLVQVLSTEKVSKKKVQSATQSLSAPGPSSAPGLLSASQDVPSSTDVPAAPVVHSETASAAGAEVTPKVDVHTASRHSQVRSHKLGRQLNASRLVQVLSTEEESKKKTHNASQTSPTPGLPFASQAASISAEVPSAPVVQLETANAGGGEVQASADLEEGELEYARTPSPPPSHATIASHPASHGTHSSHGATPALGPLLGRQPQHLNQVFKDRLVFHFVRKGISVTLQDEGFLLKTFFWLARDSHKLIISLATLLDLLFSAEVCLRSLMILSHITNLKNLRACVLGWISTGWLLSTGIRPPVSKFSCRSSFSGCNIPRDWLHAPCQSALSTPNG